MNDQPRFDDDIDSLLASAPAPITPPAHLKDDIFAAIDAPAQQPADIDDYRAKRRPAGFIAAAAAAVAIIVGGAIVAIPTDDDPATQQAQQTHDTMHHIMDAEDARTANAEAHGASLSIVVSESMDSGGAMVDGAPELGDGMGAQVWAVMEDGSMESAGVIGPEPHEDVWMPLPGDTEKVMVTEEPVAGSAHPEGAVLAEVHI